MKKYVIAVLSLVMVSNLAHAGMCEDSASASRKAVRALNKVRKLADSDGFASAISSSGVLECNPSDFRRALDSNGGFLQPQIAYPNECAAVFTFADQASMNTFVQKIKDADLSDATTSKICMSIDFARAGPAVSAGNFQQAQ